MNITIQPISIVDYPVDCLFLTTASDLTSSFSKELRDAVESAAKSHCHLIYLDSRQSKEADLSGINEVIHAHHALKRAGKKMIFVYAQGSTVQKWVEVTGLYRFVETAIITHP